MGQKKPKQSVVFILIFLEFCKRASIGGLLYLNQVLPPAHLKVCICFAAFDTFLVFSCLLLVCQIA